jgi:5'-nucleotidase (lipoprotein e(P4) family)
MRQTTIAAFLLLASCATTAPPPTASPSSPSAETTAVPTPAAAAAPCRPGDALVNAALWMQSAAEYRASALQSYALAKRLLDLALADPSWSAVRDAKSAGLPPAVILDSDETVFDNTGFEARMIQRGMKYDSAAWRAWVDEAAATAIPGAADFLAYAKSRGVTPFFVTNRKADEEPGTRRNLEKLGFPLGTSEDTVLVRGERPEWASGDKEPRRKYVASRYRVLLLVGDDLNDFVTARDLTVAERDAIMRDTAAEWGSKWIILPNAMYGSWEDAVAGSGSDCAQLQKKIEAMRTP